MRESNPAEHREIPNALSAILHDALVMRALRDAEALDADSLEAAIIALEGRVEPLQHKGFLSLAKPGRLRNWAQQVGRVFDDI